MFFKLAGIFRNMSHLIPDFKPGPLDLYRNIASFDWKKFKIFLETEDIIKYENDIYRALQDHPDYSVDKRSAETLDEQRRLSAKQARAQKSLDQLSLYRQIENLKRPTAATRIMMQIAPGSTIKYAVGDRLFMSTLLTMGSERHAKYINEAEEGTIFGCYCLTEIGHGSNARGMRTTATYNKEKKVFVLQSPDFEAAKCWAGGLGQLATHGTFYAQLILDGINYGLHAFVVPIRNPKTFLPYAGLIVGDMGEKIGLNGIDNGFVQFDNYEIPRENLLNKVADVTEDGQYISPIRDPNKRHGAALGALSSGRIYITCICETMGIKALTIAIRYAAVRKQFGPDDNTEMPILEYQSHQYRLLPYLAACYVLRIFNTDFSQMFFQFSLDALGGNSKEDAPEKGIEIHALSSACKPMAGWIMKEAIQECREACGGHGYLKVAGIGDIRNDHDANLTYEGENHVLIQQTSKWLLKFWPRILEKEHISSPLRSVDFLTNGLNILTNKFIASSIEEVCCPMSIIKTYQWLITYLLKITYEKYQKLLESGKGAFWAKNDTQVFYAKNLAIAYIQHFFLQTALKKSLEVNDGAIKRVLTKLISLYGLWSLEKHIPTLYRGQFLEGPMGTILIQEAILKLCSELKDDAVSLIDVVAPPDFVLNSVLGASDGMVYKHLKAAIMGSEYGLSRPKWWQEIKNYDLKNKL